MQFIIGKEQLVNSLAKVQSIVEKRSAMPILEHVKVDIAERIMTLTTTDMDIMVSNKLQINSDISCSFTTPAQPFYEIVRKLYGCDEIILNLNHENNEEKLIITGGAGCFHIPYLSNSNFPSFDDLFNNGTKMFLQGEHLYYLLFQTKHAISSGETRYYLNGAYLHQCQANVLTVVTTDAHRLAKSEIQLSSNNEDILDSIDKDLSKNINGVIIPRKTVFELIKLLEANKGSQIELFITERKIKFIIGNTVIISKLIDAKFPDYKTPLAQIFLGQKVELKVKELMKAIDLVVSVLEDKIKKVKLIFEGDHLIVSVENQISHHASGIQRIAINYGQEKIEILLNARYITDSLSVIKGENAVLNIRSPIHPIVMQDRDDKSSLYVLMPMQLGDNNTENSTH